MSEELSQKELNKSLIAGHDKAVAMSKELLTELVEHKREIYRQSQLIKELEEKLSLYEWKPLALVEQEGDKYPKGQKFDLWIKDFDKFPSLGPYSYILHNITWSHEEGRWLNSSDEYLTDKVYIHATHARPVITPPTQEGDKE